MSGRIADDQLRTCRPETIRWRHAARENDRTTNVE
jgi:hypothetical protein